MDLIDFDGLDPNKREIKRDWLKIKTIYLKQKKKISVLDENNREN